MSSSLWNGSTWFSLELFGEIIFTQAHPPQSLLAEPLQFVNQGAAADAQGLGGFGAVEIIFLQGVDAPPAFDLIQTLRLTRIHDPSAGPGTGRTRAGRCSGKINSPPESSAARSMALRNSRTLPARDNVQSASAAAAKAARLPL